MAQSDPVAIAAMVDRQVAAAADAWLAEPSDTVAYQRLVQAVERRRRCRQPALSTPGQGQVWDDVAAARAPVRLGELLDQEDLGRPG